MAVAVAVAVAVSGGGAVAVAVAVAGLTKRFFNHIQKDFLINVWGYLKRELLFYRKYYFEKPLKREKKKRDWKGCQKMMSNEKVFLQELSVFDANGIVASPSDGAL